MNGLDTNVLVRYIVEDDTKQTQAATDIIENQCTPQHPGYVNIVVLCELVWVLERAYHCNKSQICRVLMNLLLTENIMVEHHDIAWLAYGDFDGSNTDFADCLISRMNRAGGCDTTFTFDKKAAKLKSNTLLID